MKKLTVLFALFSVVIFSCKKSDSGSTGNNPYNYIINGVTDVTVPANSSSNLSVEVKYSSGTQEAVTLSVSGLPNGISASITPNSGTPTFTSVINISASSSATPGNYPIKIKGTSASGITKEYSCNLTISGDCAAQLAGNYTGGESCTTGSASYALQITKDNTGANKISVVNIYDWIPILTVSATVDCINHTLNIPTQTQNGITISGSGTFPVTHDKVTITYTISDATSSNTCTYIGQK